MVWGKYLSRVKAGGGDKVAADVGLVGTLIV